MTREERIQWWREARFGMFIHWGLYALPAGAWLATNQEAIYGTMPWRVFRDDSPVDIRFTSKGNSVYAIFPAWPDKDVMVKALGKTALPDKTISAVSMLGSNEPILWRQNDEGLTLSVPLNKPCDYACVYKINQEIRQ